MPNVKAWKDKLNLETYQGSSCSTLQVVDSQSRELLGAEVSIPVQIMYRLYHLGRAYDFHTMKLLRPDGKSILDWTHIQQLRAEIECLSDIVVDPVVAHFVSILLSRFEATNVRTACNLIYVSPQSS
ncbi:hypothetical protein [Agarivorans gilvus]|uniref:Uncharacterized protein n=1 Tax=Agarivorans gilvus TaxID=680279 RepID=A0ABQ1I459_9ALTE|nr:hypothetical protein [Agarivorans gilvus]GGB14883.1 hypothetical protein GCM10007414_30410 [Agarivorans gilvus]